MAELELTAQSSSITLTLGEHSIRLSPNEAGQLAGQLLCAAHGGDAEFTHTDERPALVAVAVGAEPTPRPIPIPRPTPPKTKHAPAAIIAWSTATGEEIPKPTFTARAREQMALLGLSEHDVMSVLDSPDAVVPPKFGNADNYRGNNISVLLSRDGRSRIIGVSAFSDKASRQANGVFERKRP